ncbi:MAG: Crp/Fnr family transcriptional regulator [Anaerolineales bacterium]|nr:Crp/Fnr family transcriptional regulator [Anaerolineales bacterium]MCX7756670.1 Crp/Fnr family transcriptional regulator [Anaerolineales bacterium]MDW8277255.1 Crp/Fnr family transcriptional regulator [Anaerolineales bacterium]
MLTSNTANTRNLLEGIALFEGLDPLDLNWISARARRRLFAAGTNILTAEQPGEAVYVILHGTVKIHVEQADGRDVVLAILGAGDTLGEMSLIDSAGRSASAVTLEESLLLWMDKSAFQESLRRFPAVAQNLVRILSARVRLANELIQALASMDVNGRVARQLLAFADKYGRAEGASVLIPIHLTQSDIADLVGASRKRVNQVMVAFREQELIATNTTGRIIVLNRDGLMRYCR